MSFDIDALFEGNNCFNNIAFRYSLERKTFTTTVFPYQPTAFFVFKKLRFIYLPKLETLGEIYKYTLKI